MQQVRTLVSVAAIVIVGLAWSGLTALALLLGTLFLSEFRRRGRAERAARDNERHYRLLADHSTDMIARTDLDGLRCYASPSCRAIFGYEAHEMVGRNVIDDTHPEDRTAWDVSRARLLAGAPSAFTVVRQCRRDGSYVWIEANGRLVTDPVTGEREIVSVVRDVSLRKAVEEELAAAKEEAEAASRAKSMFLASMSHELRAPLNAVIGFSDLMQREVFGALGNPKYREYAEDIRASGEHLLALINDVLDEAKAASGMLELNEAMTDLNAVFTFTDRMLAPRAERAGVALEIRDNVPGCVLRADERRLKQVLVNLVTNAIKFTPQGGRVMIAADKSPAGDLLLTVEDDGIGIDPVDQQRVFEPFQQAGVRGEQSPTAAGGVDAREGTGLGLPLTKRLVELHGGSLVLRSFPGVGTMVVVRLPAHRMMAAIKPAPAPPRPGRIALVLDDDPSVCDTAALLLEDMGWAVIKAHNANEAFAELQREPGIDLLFTDVFMPPGMSGTELANYALKLRPDLRVLLTSGFAGNVTEYADGSGRVHASVQKPYRAAELRAAIATLCGMRREDVSVPDAADEFVPIQRSA